MTVMEWFSIVFTVLPAIVIFIWLFSNGRPRNLPPGPWAPPIIGHLLTMKGDALIESFEKLRRKYGDIFTLYLGDKPLVVINNFKLYKEVFVTKQDSTYYRPTGMYAVDKLTEGKGKFLTFILQDRIKIKVLFEIKTSILRFL